MPVIWLIDAYRVGERAQVRALVDALGWPCETKVLAYRKRVFLPHVLGQSTLRGLEPKSVAALSPPWPDLVVTCGVRNEPVCRWIRDQSDGKTRYVHVGRPWAPLDTFDLVIETPQYRIPACPNVLNNALCLNSVSPEILERERGVWQEKFAELPRPRFAVVVGGNSGPFTFGPKAATRLGREASQLAAAQGGSLLVTTSSRTSEAATKALQTALFGPNYFYRWKDNDSANPYKGILSWADRFIVTGDSVSMLSEACATGKPVRMFDIGGMRNPADESSRDFRLGGTLYAFMLRWLWRPLSRDLTKVHSRLREMGCAAWIDEALSTVRVPAESDLQRSVVAVKELLGEL